MAHTLYQRLRDVLSSDFTGYSGSTSTWPSLQDAQPADRTDLFLSLLAIYDLSTAPLTGDPASLDRARWAAHPAVAAVKLSLEQAWLEELDRRSPALSETDPVRAIRGLAAKDRLPGVYRWIAEEATHAQLLHFLALEGGPDGGFDDLVATCQIGLSGAPKMELARNYWDEMGNGEPAAVHTDLHLQMSELIGLRELERTELPEASLQRAALGGLLATNRWLQPEMVGALGLTELQAGPRCRLVLNAFDRLGVPAEAHEFYAVHADVDPRHGKDWLEQAVAPLAELGAEWSQRMIRGAAWRWQVNAELFGSLETRMDVTADVEVASCAA